LSKLGKYEDRLNSIKTLVKLEPTAYICSMEKQKEYPNLIRLPQKPEVAHIEKKQGIYRIIYNDGTYYVGSSDNLNSRASNYMCVRQSKHASGGLKKLLQVGGVFGVIEYTPYLNKVDLLLLEREEVIKDGNKTINRSCPACRRKIATCNCCDNYKEITKMTVFL